MNWWIISLLVVFLYVQLFNIVANLYFDSERTMTLKDLWRKVVPPIKIEL
jgi:hypothetical protein